MDIDKQNPEKEQDNKSSELIPKNLKLKKSKHIMIISLVIIVLIVIIGFYRWDEQISNNKLQMYMTEFIKDYNFIDSWEVTGNSLKINTNNEYDKFDLKTKYEKFNDLYDDFTSALQGAKKPKIDYKWIESIEINIKHKEGDDFFNYSGLITADNKEFDSRDLELSSPVSDTSSSNYSYSYSTTPSDDNKAFAWTAALNEVKSKLKAPSTAKFPFSYYDQDIQQIDYDTFVVNSYVDAENSFGAKIRSNFSVTIRKTGSNSYVVENIYIE